MANKIKFRNEDLKEAIAEFIDNAGEDSFIGIIMALADAYQQKAVFPVAADGDVFRTIHDDEDGDFLSMFTDLDEAEMGPETDLILMTMEDLAGNLLEEHELSGIIINAFSDPIFVDRDAVRAMIDTALSGPYKEVILDVEEMDAEELVELAVSIENGEDGFMADPLTAASIYSNVSDDDFDLEPEDADPDEMANYNAYKAEATRRLAELHLKGFGVDYDPEEAENLLKDAAKMLDTTAMFDLGMISEGREDWKEAAKYYQKAALMGDTKALAAYGRLLMKGLGVPMDQELAFDCLKKAAADPEGEGEAAYYCLGLYYEEGILGIKDEELAGAYYELGSEAGDVKAMEGYQRIFGVPYEDDDDDDDDEEDDDDDMTFETNDDREFYIDMSKLPKGIKN